MLECNLLFNTKDRFRAHKQQALSGFIALQRQKVISLKIDYNSDIDNPVTNSFYCEINKKKVIYDVDDGIDNLSQEALDYIHQGNIFLFKRAYDEQLYKNDYLIKPYGLNYCKKNAYIERIYTRHLDKGNLSARFIHLFLSKSDDWNMMDYNRKRTNRILFCTRLWEQKYTSSPVDELNEFRIRCIYSLRKAFPGNIIAGVKDSQLSRRLCKDLILPDRITKRKNYLDLICQSDVCVTTTGLHRSIGWKFGEFVASGKAILSEPLFFSVPGDFCEEHNYLSFTSPQNLTEKCDCLLSNPVKRREMEYHNINYYYHFLRPDVLIWNTIKQIV